MRPWFRLSVIVTLALAGATAAVYAAQTSLPTSPLYALKLAGEDVRLSLTRAPAARLRVLFTYVETRTREIARLAEEHTPVPERTVARLEAQLAACLWLTAQEDDAPMAGDLLRLRDRLATQTQLMDNARALAPADARLAQGLGALRQTQAAVEIGLQAPQRFREQVAAGPEGANGAPAVTPGQGPGPRP